MKTKLTGKVRYRNQYRFLRSPLLILQVEERMTAKQPTPVDITYFRDATINDLPVAATKPVTVVESDGL